jgi:hypothetical protein
VPISFKQQDGYFEVVYSFDGALGLAVQQPENIIPDKATPAVSNFFMRNAELRSRPTFQFEFAPPDTNQILGQFSFIDANSINHTCCFTTKAMYQLKGNKIPPNQNPWAYLAGPTLQADTPVTYRAFANIMYYSNGNPHLAYWDGISQYATNDAATISMADAPTVVPGSTGPLTIGGLYLGELDNHLLLANVNVLDTETGVIYPFPQRLWWSANGLPLVWDPAANTNAGFNDFLDCPDVLTGIMTIGIAGFLFRSNGITQFTPTGNGLAPFQFDHLWASDHGIGNVYPWSIAQYGPNGFFVSTEQIYQMTVNSFNPIGGMTRDAIFADLAQASGNPVASMVPTLGLGYIFQHYVIAIPLTSFTRFYVFSIEDNNWTQWDVQGLIVTGKEEECWTGQLPTFSVPGVFPPAVSTSGTGTAGGGTSPGGGGGLPGPDNPLPNPNPNPPLAS